LTEGRNGTIFPAKRALEFLCYVGVALGIVYLMVVKPDLLESIVSIGVALALGAAADLVGRRPGRPAVPAQDAGGRATRPA